MIGVLDSHVDMQEKYGIYTDIQCYTLLCYMQKNGAKGLRFGAAAAWARFEGIGRPKIFIFNYLIRGG